MDEMYSPCESCWSHIDAHSVEVGKFFSLISA